MASPERQSKIRLRLEQLRPLLAWAWAHREGFQRVMSHPGWARCFQVVSVLSFVMAVFVYYQQQDLIVAQQQLLQRQDRFVHCIADYLDAQSAASDARSKAIQDSLNAVDASIHAVATSTTRAQVAKALADYEARRVAIRAQIQANPLPSPPAERCD